jgi:hypothetical protein
VSEERRNGLRAAAILAGVPALLFIDVIAGLGVFYRGDAGSFFFPIRSIVREIVLSGEFPWWNPMFGAGQPLAANPAYELFYPLTWLTFLPNLTYVFQLVALLHVYLAIFATYALIRDLGTGRPASAVGALSFGLGGVILSGLHLFPILFSAAWMPVTCLFTRRFLRGGAPRHFAAAAVAFGLQLLVGEPVTVLQTGILLGLYALFRERPRPVASVARDVLLVGAISLGALAVSAVQTLPMLDHYRDSVRAHGFPFSHVADWSTPPLRLAELVYPGIFGSARADGTLAYWGVSLYGDLPAGFYPAIYCGLLVTVLLLSGLIARTRGWMLTATAIAVSLVTAFGDFTPLLRFLYDAGLARSLRYPEKFLLLGVFAMTLFASSVLDRILAGDARVRRIAVMLALFTAIGAAAAAAVFSSEGADERFRAMWNAPTADVTAMVAAFRASWLLALGRGAFLALVLAAAGRARKNAVAALLLLFVVADLAPSAAEIAPRMPPSFYDEPPGVLRSLGPDRDAYRIFVPGNWSPDARNRGPYLGRHPAFFLVQRNALTGLTPAIWGVRTVGASDFDRTALQATSEFLAASQQLSASTPEWLNFVSVMSNVRYIGVYQPIERELARTEGDITRVEPLRLVEGSDHPRFYFATDVVRASRRDDFVAAIASGRHGRHTAFIDGDPFVPARGRVLSAKESSAGARIAVESEGRAFLVISITPHKYWTITIDGSTVPAVRTNLGYQGVVVPPGRHVVAMRYRNPLVLAGGAVSVVTLLALGLAAAALRRGRIAHR